MKLISAMSIIGACAFIGLAAPSFTSSALSDEKGAPAKAPLAATAIIDAAKKEAKAKKKNIFLHYTASWCGWCKRLEKVMDTEPYKKGFADNFVIISLDVMENGDKKSLENPGGMELLKEHGGDKGGIPFIVILNEKGEKIADSNVMPGDVKNIGCPATDEEIAAFDKILTKTAPKMSSDFRTKLGDHFRELNKKKN
jgi:thiol:disulfide interchange protein